MNYAIVSDIKNKVIEKFGINLHFHDTCGCGMYFSLDERNDDISDFVCKYFAALNMQTTVSENGLNLTVED